jgi:hypothetical protein
MWADAATLTTTQAIRLRGTGKSSDDVARLKPPFGLALGKPKKNVLRSSAYRDGKIFFKGEKNLETRRGMAYLIADNLIEAFP